MNDWTDKLYAIAMFIVVVSLSISLLAFTALGVLSEMGIIE